MKYLLDTDICIEMIRRKPQRLVTQLAIALPYGVAISSIGLAELELGVQQSKESENARGALERFLRPFVVLPFDQQAAQAYGRVHTERLNLGQPIGPFDTLIAAHALSRGLILVANNERESRRVPGLTVENWLA